MLGIVPASLAQLNGPKVYCSQDRVIQCPLIKMKVDHSRLWSILTENYSLDHFKKEKNFWDFLLALMYTPIQKGVYSKRKEIAHVQILFFHKNMKNKPIGKKLKYIFRQLTALKVYWKCIYSFLILTTCQGHQTLTNTNASKWLLQVLYNPHNCSKGTKIVYINRSSLTPISPINP